MKQPDWANDPRGFPPVVIDRDGDPWLFKNEPATVDIGGDLFKLSHAGGYVQPRDWDRERARLFTPAQVEHVGGPTTPLWPDKKKTPETWARAAAEEFLSALQWTGNQN